jgi:hypothetical protein
VILEITINHWRWYSTTEDHNQPLEMKSTTGNNNRPIGEFHYRTNLTVLLLSNFGSINKTRKSEFGFWKFLRVFLCKFRILKAPSLVCNMTKAFPRSTSASNFYSLTLNNWTNKNSNLKVTDKTLSFKFWLRICKCSTLRIPNFPNWVFNSASWLKSY